MSAYCSCIYSLLCLVDELPLHYRSFFFHHCERKAFAGLLFNYLPNKLCSFHVSICFWCSGLERLYLRYHSGTILAYEFSCLYMCLYHLRHIIHIIDFCFSAIVKEKNPVQDCYLILAQTNFVLFICFHMFLV